MKYRLRDMVAVAVLICGIALLSAPILAAVVSKIQVRRGTEAQLPAKAAMGEPMFTTDTHRFFVGYSTGMEEYLQRARFLGYTAATAQRLAAVWLELSRQQARMGNLSSQLPGKFNRSEHEQFSSAMAEALAGKVTLGGLGRFSEVRTPGISNDFGQYFSVTDAVNHFGNENNPHATTAAQLGLATVATSGSYADLANKPSIPAAQINSDWTASGTLAEILNKPVIPVACGSDPATAIFDGAPALSCVIDSGLFAFTYDETGVNPLPEMLPYTVKLYEAGLLVTPSTYHWSVPTSNSLLTMGQYSTQSSFTPNRHAVYSSARNNWIKAMLTYNGKTCVAVAPVLAGKIGTTGERGFRGYSGLPGANGADGVTWNFVVGTVTNLPNGSTPYVNYSTSAPTTKTVNYGVVEGPQGSNATVTEASVMSAFFNSPTIYDSDSSLILQATSATSTTKLQVNDSDAYPRIVMTSTGLLLIKDRDGNIRWGFDTTTNAMTMRRGSNVIFEVASTGRTAWYRPGSSRTIMRLYTSGRVEF